MDDYLLPEQKAQNSRAESLKRELHRRSMDQIRVYNPTEEDFVVDWDGYKHVVPSRNKDLGWGKGMRVIFRYLAVNYRKHMSDKIIHALADGELDKIKQVLVDRGDTDAVYNANDRFQRTNKYRTDNEDLLKKIWKQIWLGVEQRYGVDDILPDVAEPVDTRTGMQRLAEEFDDIQYSPTQSQERVAAAAKPPVDEGAKAKQKIVSEVSK